MLALSKLAINKKCSLLKLVFKMQKSIYTKSLGYVFGPVHVYWKHTLGANPMISSSLKQSVCFCQVLPALGTLFYDTHLYLGAGGYRLPLHNSKEPLMRERQMCLHCKQERGNGEWCRAMPRDLLWLPGGCSARQKYGQEQSLAWKHNNTCLCSYLPETQACMQLGRMNAVQ